MDLRISNTLGLDGNVFVPTLGLSFTRAAGRNYTLQSTADLNTWTNIGTVPGNGEEISVPVQTSVGRQLFRLLQQ